MPMQGYPFCRAPAPFFPESPEKMAAVAPQLAKAGANIIGGCCGTTPDHIHRIVEVLHSENK